MLEDIPLWAVTNLSPVEFDVCHELLRLAPVPLVLSVPSPGRTRQQRRDVVAEALARLTRRGLADPHGVHPDLAAALRGLTDCQWAVDLRYWTGDRLLRACGAVRGDLGVIAGIDAGRVAVYTVPDHAVVNELLATTGEPRSTGPRNVSVNVRTTSLAAAVTRAGSRGAALADELVAQGESRPAARAVGHMTDDVHAWGQLGTCAYQGRQAHRASSVVAFHDTPIGRITQLRRGEWTTFTPISNARLAEAVVELVVDTRSAVAVNGC
jgi:hypothetical protein